MRRVLLVAFAILLGAAASAQAAPATLHLSFRQEGPAASVITNGRYVLIRAPAGGTPTLIDEQSRKRVALPQCANGPDTSGFEGPWFEWSSQGLGSALSGCPGTDRTLTMYTLRTGATRTIDLGSVAGCNAKFNPCQYPGPAGTVWMVLEAPNACDCGTEAWLRNLKTGGEVALPDRATVNGIADLSSPTQTFRVCAPLPKLRVKLGRHTTSTTANWFFGGDTGFLGSGIQRDSDFGFTWSDSGAWLGNYAVGYDEPGNPYLEHCGTRLARRLSTGQFTGNRSALILLPRASGARLALRGLFLENGLRTFTVPLPVALQGPTTQFVLSRRTLWAVADGEAWAAAAPAPPRRHR